jgi:hypothetical protein
MGMFFRLLAPKPLKSARRAMHPVSLIDPAPGAECAARRGENDQPNRRAR